MSEHLKPSQSIFPKEMLLKQARAADRRIENCWWFRPVQIDFDRPQGLPENSIHQIFIDQLSESLQRQGHPAPKEPGKDSQMIIGFAEISREGSLMEKVEEIDPLVLKAAEKYRIRDILKKNYTAVVEIEDDIAALPKREMEEATRMLMLRLGAFKIIILNPNYYALATMEGGLGIEPVDNPQAIDRFRDRLVTHAIAKEAGGCEKVKDVIGIRQWRSTRMPRYMADAFRQLATWGYIDKPFEFEKVASRERARLGGKTMGWSRQSESASAAFDPAVQPPQKYQMGQATGAIPSTASGRFNVDKTDMDPERDITIVAIVPKPDYKRNPDDPLNLEGFDRYALGIRGRPIAGPSIEFDEMAATFFISPLVRLSPHPSGEGYKLDPRGEIVMPKIRAFVHIHQGVEEVRAKNLWGKSALEMTEYIKANLNDYPYPVGCGKDIMFALSTDAARRSIGANRPNSGILISYFDAIDHGTNFLILAEPIPGTDFIPENPYDVLLTLTHPTHGAIRLTDELPLV